MRLHLAEGSKREFCRMALELPLSSAIETHMPVCHSAASKQAGIDFAPGRGLAMELAEHAFAKTEAARGRVAR